ICMTLAVLVAPADGPPAVEADAAVDVASSAAVPDATDGALVDDVAPRQEAETRPSPAAATPAADEEAAEQRSAEEDESERFTIAGGSGRVGPPYYSQADADAFLAHRSIPQPAAPRAAARWR